MKEIETILQTTSDVKKCMAEQDFVPMLPSSSVMVTTIVTRTTGRTFLWLRLPDKYKTETTLRWKDGLECRLDRLTFDSKKRVMEEMQKQQEYVKKRIAEIKKKARCL